MLSPVLDERMRRLVVACEAEAIGYGGTSAVARATGVSRPVIRDGIKELRAVGGEGEPAGSGTSGTGKRRIRKPGGGRKRAVEKDPALRHDLDWLVDPVTRGDPESPLRWTCKSVRKLAEELRAMGHDVSHRVVAELLHEMGYSLQANKKTLEGAGHPDRDAQFRYINDRVRAVIDAGCPAISVDTKKKELVGDFKNGGREWRPNGDPERVRVHDFRIPELGRAAPYGVYDIGRNVGWVSVGVDHDTAEFAVAAIRRWWQCMGRETYPGAHQLLITADAGGSNGSRLRLWKLELQQLAGEVGFPITVCHFPPGTSKWNKIEHRLFSFITKNWRGKPLVSHEVIVNLIAATTTTAGLTVAAELDSRSYQKGRKVSDQEMAGIKLQRHDFHGDWNYTVHNMA